MHHLVAMQENQRYQTQQNKKSPCNNAQLGRRKKKHHSIFHMFREFPEQPNKGAYLRFFLQAFFLPPVARLLCMESREIPGEEIKENP